MKEIKQSAEYTTNYVKRMINSCINNSFSVKIINPKYSNANFDIQTLRTAESEIFTTNIKQLADTSSFTQDLDSLTFISPFIKSYKGFSLFNNKEVELIVYSKECLKFIFINNFFFNNKIKFNFF